MDLTTNYLGLTLKNPVVPSASPLSKHLDTAKRLEDAGASALVMYSLFEEEVRYDDDMLDEYFFHQDIGHLEASSYRPQPDDHPSAIDNYIEQLHRLKESLEIPIVASLNGVTPGGWTEHAQELQVAGADALELNIYHVSAEVTETGEMVEQRYIDVLKAVKKKITIPVVVKLSPHFSSVANMVHRLEQAGVTVIEARISHLAYAPEIANAMLRRQQASAIIAARKQIVRGAVGMVHLALDELDENDIVDLDEERKAAMVSNLLVVLCGEEATTPVVNAGTLYT